MKAFPRVLVLNVPMTTNEAVIHSLWIILAPLSAKLSHWEANRHKHDNIRRRSVEFTKFQTKVCVNKMFYSPIGNKFVWLSSSGPSLLCFFNQKCLCYSNCWSLRSWHVCCSANFLPFTWKFMKKKTEYALFQIGTEFDCLLKTEYSIRGYRMQRSSWIGNSCLFSANSGTLISLE